MPSTQGGKRFSLIVCNTQQSIPCAHFRGRFFSFVSAFTQISSFLLRHFVSFDVANPLDREKSRLQFTALGNGDSAACLSARRTFPFDCLDNIHALADLSKYDVLSVQPRRDDSRDEELGALWYRKRQVRPKLAEQCSSILTHVCVGSSIGHRQETWLSVLLLEVLVGEPGASGTGQHR